MLVQILTMPKNALVPQYQMLFGMDKVSSHVFFSLSKKLVKPTGHIVDYRDLSIFHLDNVQF